MYFKLSPIAIANDQYLAQKKISGNISCSWLLNSLAIPHV